MPFPFGEWRKKKFLLVSHPEKAGEREQNKKMKRKKTVAEVLCEKKLMRNVVDSLKQLIRRVSDHTNS